MATYAIGDIQGCFDEFIKLLELINFNEQTDTLWSAGDLVNRGPNSYKVLEFFSKLPNKVVVLGNHDLHLLATVFANRAIHKKDTFQDVIKHDRGFKLCHWLRKQHLIYHDDYTKYTLVHAGIPPQWDIAEAIARAIEIETILSSNKFIPFLQNMYGNIPNKWDPFLSGMARLRIIVNYFVRLRFCTKDGVLDLDLKNASAHEDHNYLPWFDVPNRKTINDTIVFGHWSALNGKTNNKNAIALDTGCVWGNKLTAFCIETNKLYSVKSNYKFIE